MSYEVLKRNWEAIAAGTEVDYITIDFERAAIMRLSFLLVDFVPTPARIAAESQLEEA